MRRGEFGLSLSSALTLARQNLGLRPTPRVSGAPVHHSLQSTLTHAHLRPGERQGLARALTWVTWLEPGARLSVGLLRNRALLRAEAFLYRVTSSSSKKALPSLITVGVVFSL